MLKLKQMLMLMMMLKLKTKSKERRERRMHPTLDTFSLLSPSNFLCFLRWTSLCTATIMLRIILHLSLAEGDTM